MTQATDEIQVTQRQGPAATGIERKEGHSDGEH
jgi:hypothetical protein